MEKDWPPAYSVRHSRKARRIFLRVSDERGLELVLPEKYRKADIQAILAEHRDWIRRRLARRAAHLALREALQPSTPFYPPAGFWLHGGELRVDLDIGPGLGGAAMQELLASAPAYGTVCWPMAVGREQELLRRLVMFIKFYARRYLGNRLREVAGRHAFACGKVAFATQKSRWGSYAPDGAIRLNHKLVFLPPALADSVILHELCHSVHPNHSSRFHALMQEKDSESAKKNGELRQAGIWVPAWFL